MAELSRTLTLRQLQIFATAARQLSFARTAEALFLSQPAVSMQIRQLEESVGMPLFERVGRKLALTEAGERLSHHASRILGELKDAEDSLRSLRSALQGTVVVGLVSTAKYFAPRLLARYAETHPGVDVQFVVGNREGLIAQLRDNAIDLAIMGRPPEELGAVAEPLARHPYVLIARPDHPLRDARDFDLHELRHETFMLREQGSGSRAVTEQMFKHHLFVPAKAVTMGSNETIKQAVMAGMGVSLLSLHTLPLELRTREIAILHANGTPIERVWNLVHMASKRLSPACQDFRAYLLEHAAPSLDAEYGPYLEPEVAARPGV